MAQCGTCTKCCQAIGLNGTAAKHIRDGSDNYTEGQWIRDNWEEISTWEALSINPHLGVWNISTQFYTCKNLTDKGCGIYETRPNICRGYPWYDDKITELKKIEVSLNNKHTANDYSEVCAYKINFIPVKIID